MSTINTVLKAPAAYAAPIAVDAPATSSASFSNTLAVAQAPKTLLTTAENSQASRPNIKAFMDRTGAQFLDASELIYGVVGSNTDVRDWTAIMASNDPISAARQATGEMYGRTDITPRTDATYIGASDTVAKEGNFAVRLLKDEDNKVVDQGLKLIDAQGLLLRDAGSSPETIARNAWLFGFDTQPLAKLAAAAATVSADLGKAVQQASVKNSFPPVNTAAIQMPVMAMAADNAKLMGLSGLNLLSTSQSSTAQSMAEPVVKAQKDDQASSPSLEQVLQEASTKAFGYLDSATYLSSLFKA
jgi:hypothetical protein